VTVLHVCANLYGKQVFYCTNMANRFCTVQYCCIFVLLFGQYLLKLDNKWEYPATLPPQARDIQIKISKVTQNKLDVPQTILKIIYQTQIQPKTDGYHNKDL